jgi:hypothetical protein
LGLGSLEGAYLAQKMKKKESIWDESVMDSSQYGQGLASSIDEVKVDIEFAKKPIQEEAPKS